MSWFDWQKISKKLRSPWGKAHKDGFVPKEELDFLDSSAAERLKGKCQEIFPPEQLDEFANYQIVTELGRGNMGIVYKAIQIQEKHIYAIKVLSRRVLHNPQSVNRFFQEICIHRTLIHPNIIRFYKIGVATETVFIVMEYVAGNDLETWLKRQTALSERDALQLIIPVAQALHYAHSIKIIHRDLKPANILIEEKTHIPKIADFGIAKLGSSSPQDENIFGTPAYMSPEQIRSSHDVDIRTDLYALGSILYHVLTGKRPYADITDPVMLLHTKVKEDPEDIAKLVPGLQEETKKLVRSAMARDVKNRCKTPAEFLQLAQQALEKVQLQLPEGHKIAPLRPSEQLKEESRRRPTGFIPQMASTVDVPELFMTATRYEISEASKTFHRESKLFQQSPVGALLKDGDEESAEFEETLLSMSMEPTGALRLPESLQQLLAKAKGKSLLDNIINLPQMFNLDSQQKNILTELRYLLVLRGNSLTRQKTLIAFINEGTARLERKVEELSRVTESRTFNKQVRQYFAKLVNDSLQNYHEAFRQDFFACKNADEVACYLENYTLTSTTTLARYRNLKIIAKIKQVQQALEQEPGELEKILAATFGPHEQEFRKVLVEHYIKKGDENTLWAAIARAQDLPGLMLHVLRLQGKAEFKSMATRIASLIEVFLDSGGRTSLEKLQTSLNFLPSVSRDKVCQLVRARLYVELEQKVQEILSSTEQEEKRFRNFLALLQNPRYHHPGLKLYGYPVQILAGKVSQIRSQKETMEQAFSEGSVPQEILGLICEDQEMEMVGRAKTIDNCIKELKRLATAHVQPQPGQLLKSLLKVFNCYGKINLTEAESFDVVNGYQIAQQIVRFYNEPRRTCIELPDNLHPDIATLVKQLVDGERERQLRTRTSV